MSTPRQELLELLARQSFQLGEFKLSSGATSDYYIDCRTTTLDAEGARLTGRVFLDEIRVRGWRPKAIGGLTLGADPIVVAVALLSSQHAQRRGAERGPVYEPVFPLIHGFLVRKQEKGHGTGQRIEGYREPGAEVVIVDDVCTTGGSTIQAIEAARDFGFKVIGVMCLVEREDAGGRPAVERAAAPASFVSVFTAGEVREQHLKRQALRAAL
ncbi:MAG TPA: orotate phosphoribosyltransferase [Terriglobales bacterium]|nr:orotate phosphoribosyltransferase [Terriglobales bacterium]